MAFIVSLPVGSRATRLALTVTAPAGTAQTQWKFESDLDSTFAIITTFTGSTSANVLDSDLDTLDIWLPPSHVYTVQTRHLIAGNYTDWQADQEFTSRGPLTSFEKYQALSGIAGDSNVDNVVT